MSKIYKFGFIADIKTVTLALKFPCIVSVFWKRGQKTAQIKQRKEINQGVVTFNQKLQIECNMTWDTQKKLFEQKKTKFTVVIFSQKGTKQAGQVYVDVSEFLNNNLKKILIERNLDKCPDKNAKLTVQLSGYAKQEIKPDEISRKSDKSTKLVLETPSNIQPDFKKKRKDPIVIQKGADQKQEKREEKPFKQVKIDNNPSSIPITKENVSKVQLMALEEENKRLKGELLLLKDLQIENQALKKQYEAQQKKACQYYTGKYEQIKLEYTQMKEKVEKLRNMQKQKQNLERQLCESKDKMGAILNYAVLNRMTDLAEQLTKIYSNDE